MNVYNTRSVLSKPNRRKCIYTYKCISVYTLVKLALNLCIYVFKLSLFLCVYKHTYYTMCIYEYY